MKKLTEREIDFLVDFANEVSKFKLNLSHLSDEIKGFDNIVFQKSSGKYIFRAISDLMDKKDRPLLHEFEDSLKKELFKKKQIVYSSFLEHKKSFTDYLEKIKVDLVVQCIFNKNMFSILDEFINSFLDNLEKVEIPLESEQKFDRLYACIESLEKDFENMLNEFKKLNEGTV